jgi:phosphonate metabolism-associated iron-containing alcohol dehydrogenase
MAHYYNPVRVVFGVDEFNNITKIANLNSRRKNILLLTGTKSLKNSGYWEKISYQLDKSNYFHFNKIPSNPDVQDMFSIKRETDCYDYNYILAIGGGSVIDTGKLLAALKDFSVTSVSVLRDKIINKLYMSSDSICPICAVPTTAGTGSEVTSWATLWDRDAKAKYSIEDVNLYPKIAVVDPTLTLNLSATMTATTALDAVSHATEAYWSRNSNEIVRMYARQAIKLIVASLPKLLDNLSDINLRTHVAYGSLFAGLAFSNTKTTACHSISYPLTLSYGIDHGVAVSMTLGRMLLKNEAALVNKHELLEAFGVSHISEVENVIQRVCDKARIPLRLRDYGVLSEELACIADKSFTPGRMDNNPVDVDKEFILNLLKNIY